MTADEIIESYVADVARLLPRRQRRDVALELRLLLTEQIDATGRSGHDQAEAAREVLAGFGRPAEVAARYGTPVSLIDPADTRGFLTLAISGAALIVLGAVLNALSGPVGRASLNAGTAVAVFAWFGTLTAGFAVAAWLRRRQPQPTAWKPRPLLDDRISRPGRAAALAFFTLGTLVLIDPAGLSVKAFGTELAAPYFTYDEAFLRQRGPFVLGLMVLGLAIQATVLVQGRRRLLTERADLVHALAVCVVLTWILSAGPIFRAATTDQLVKGAIGLIILFALADIAVRAHRLDVLQAVRGPR